jgi:hypothetical protein
VFGDGARLVRLQRSDEMPFDGCAQVGERFDLRDGFLHVVLAECALARGVGGAYVVGGEGLGDGEQRDRLRVAAGRVRRALDARVDVGEVMGNI